MHYADSILLAVAVLSSCLGFSSCVHYNITITTAAQCAITQTCLTLDSFTTIAHYNTSKAVVKITLLPGNHSLVSQLLIVNIEELSIHALQNDTDTWIVCDDSGRLNFFNISTVIISKVNFLGCRDINAEVVTNYTVHMCTFIDQNVIAATLESTNVNTSIMNASRSSSAIKNATLVSHNSDITIAKCTFIVKQGRALVADLSSIAITSSTFCNSSAQRLGDNSALIQLETSTLRMQNSTIINNNGIKVFHARDCKQIVVIGSSILHNVAQHCILCVVKSNISIQTTIISENSGNFSVINLVKVTTKFIGGTFSKNNGSFLIRNSLAQFAGLNVFKNCSTAMGKRYTKTHLQAEGAITSIHSTVKFRGNISLLDNFSKGSGSAIHATGSEIQIHGSLVIANNTAEDGGGGAFLYLTHMICHGLCVFSCNRASKTGGGIHAVSSHIILKSEITRKTSKSTSMTITDNKAKLGGGFYLEMNSKISGLEENDYQYSIEFSRNTAINKGGAIYVEDKTYSTICDSNSSVDYHTQKNECFLQVYHSDDDSFHNKQTHHISFTDNSAPLGSILYGGLLDRCTVVQLSADTYMYKSTIHDSFINGLVLFQRESESGVHETDKIASDAVRVCFCQSMIPNCSYELPPVHVQKGEKFFISASAVDQVNRPTNATIHSSLKLGSNLGEGQHLQGTPEVCSDLKFNIFSPDNSVELDLHAEGPCGNNGLSVRRVNVVFELCTCPIGFHVSHNKTRCDCKCYHMLEHYVRVQDSYFTRRENSWIDFDRNNASVIIIYPNCPYDYCIPPSTNEVIDLNSPNGADTQCAFNRLGVLCGRCKQNYSLSMGTSHCIQCESWIKLLLVNFVASPLAGIVLVIMILTFNLTVTAGTLNGIIFYANVMLANRRTFLPFKDHNILVTFLSLLNTEFGLDVCIFDGMDAYTKMWLKLLFSLYMVSLVAIIIIISKFSSRCAHLLGRRNPLATLATLILFSYATLFRHVFTIFSFANLKYYDSSHEVHAQTVWRADASIHYFNGKHIPLLLTAAVIVIIGLTYTVLLFCWQWLLRAPNKLIFKWIRNTRLTSFMEAYHAPFKPTYRYWTGLLLFARLAVNLAAAIDASDKYQYNLLTVGIITVMLLILKAYSGGRLYRKKLLDYLESACYFNLLLFSLIGIGLLGNANGQNTLAYISISVTLLLFLCVIAYHIHCMLSGMKCTQRLTTRIKQCIPSKSRKLNCINNFSGTVVITSTEVGLSDSLVESESETTSGSHQNKQQFEISYNSSHLRESLLQDY